MLRCLVNVGQRGYKLTFTVQFGRKLTFSNLNEIIQNDPVWVCHDCILIRPPYTSCMAMECMPYLPCMGTFKPVRPDCPASLLFRSAGLLCTNALQWLKLKTANASWTGNCWDQTVVEPTCDKNRVRADKINIFCYFLPKVSLKQHNTNICHDMQKSWTWAFNFDVVWVWCMSSYDQNANFRVRLQMCEFGCVSQ